MYRPNNSIRSKAPTYRRIYGRHDDNDYICYWGKMATKRNWKAHHIGQGWASMQPKLKSLVLKKGKLSEDRFKLSGEYIPNNKG